MSENTKKTYTADEFKTICKDMVPHLNGLLAAARKHNLDGGIRAYVTADGFVSLEGSGFNGWELSHYKEDADYTARYSYSEQFKMGEEAQA